MARHLTTTTTTSSKPVERLHCCVLVSLFGSLASGVVQAREFERVNILSVDSVRSSCKSIEASRASDKMRLLAVGLVLGALLIGACSGATKDEPKAILESVSKYGGCVVNSTFSFLYPSSRLPSTSDELKRLCRSQADGIKCVKEKSKGGSPILRRGLLAYMNARQRHHRKYCTNLESEQSRSFLEATKCVMEKKVGAFRANDAEFAQTLLEIKRLNYNDSAPELKQLCCAFHNYKKTFNGAIGPECSAHRQMLEELGEQIVADEMSLVCEEEDKLAKLCPTLEPLKFKRLANYTPQDNESPAVVGLYLFATLGEPAR